MTPRDLAQLVTSHTLGAGDPGTFATTFLHDLSRELDPYRVHVVAGVVERAEPERSTLHHVAP